MYIIASLIISWLIVGAILASKELSRVKPVSINSYLRSKNIYISYHDWRNKAILDFSLYGIFAGKAARRYYADKFNK